MGTNAGTPTITLADAISGVEQADNSYQKAVAQTVSDLGLADAAQKKADDARGVVDGDQVAERTSAQQRNLAFRAAIDALTAGLIPGVDDPPQG